MGFMYCRRSGEGDELQKDMCCIIEREKERVLLREICVKRCMVDGLKRKSWKRKHK